jgi:hypothetical protein
MSASEQFKSAVKSYIEIHDELQASAKQLRAIRKRKTELAETILGFMKDNDIDECALSDGKLIRKTSKRVEGLKKDNIMDVLKEKLGSAAAAEALLVEIYGQRGVVEKDSLQRTHKRTNPNNE